MNINRHFRRKNAPIYRLAQFLGKPAKHRKLHAWQKKQQAAQFDKQP